MVSHVLSLCTRPDSLMPRPKYFWALIPQHLLKRGLGGPQRCSGLLRDEKIPLPGNKRPDPTLNPLNPELNPICYLLVLLGAHHFFPVNRIRVKSLNLRLLMSYIYGAPILDVSRSHTTTQHSR